MRLNQSPLDNDLVNHDYVMKPPFKKKKKRKEKGESFGPFSESFCVPPCQTPSSTRIETPLFGTLLHASLYLGVDSYALMPFVKQTKKNNQ
mgnify:CR=1 FL=1